MSREHILHRVRKACRNRAGVEHPGPLGVSSEPDGDSLERFVQSFQEVGGEVVRLRSPEEMRSWLEGFLPGFRSAAVGSDVTHDLLPSLPAAPPEDAALGVSMARLAIAETGSLLLDSRGGRRAQMLPPTHLVWVGASRLRDTLGEALLEASSDLPAALGLHSGPSRSADIGQVTVRGVHGPGRVIAAILEWM